MISSFNPFFLIPPSISQQRAAFEKTKQQIDDMINGGLSYYLSMAEDKEEAMRKIMAYFPSRVTCHLPAQPVDTVDDCVQSDNEADREKPRSSMRLRSGKEVEFDYNLARYKARTLKFDNRKGVLIPRAPKKANYKVPYFPPAHRLSAKCR
jgi:hypothetical protein